MYFKLLVVSLAIQTLPIYAPRSNSFKDNKLEKVTFSVLLTFLFNRTFFKSCYLKNYTDPISTNTFKPT